MTIRAFFLVLALSLIITSTLAVTPAAAASSDVIAYVDGTGVFVVRADGSGRRLLAELPADGDQPAWVAWAPDASAVAVVHADEDGTCCSLRVVDVAAGESRLLATVVRGRPSWAPDRDSIAVGGDGVIVLVRADGTGTRSIAVADDAEVTDPHWSPTGSHLVAHVEAGRDRVDAVAVRADGSQRTTLTGEGGSGGVAWGPRDDLLVVSRFSPNGRTASLHLVTPSGSDVATLTSGALDERPAWSPDGLTVAFTRDGHLHAVDADGTSLRRVTAEPGLSSLSWSADNLDLAGLDEDGNVVGVNAASGASRRLTTSGGVTSAAFSPVAAVEAFAERAAGPTRVETAVRMSRRAFDRADTVLIARADLYPDGLAGAPLAADLDAPMLLTPGSSLHEFAAGEIRRLGATQAVLLGGPEALAPRIEADLRALGVAGVRRLAGTSRFDTARLIAEQVGGSEVFIVEGINADPSRGWPDAVSVSGLAAHLRRPVLLARHDSLTPSTVQAIESLPVRRATIVGGTEAISEGVADQLAGLGVDVTRVAGATRYETSAELADISTRSGLDPTRTWLATGTNWPDALAAGAAVTRDGGVLVLINGQAITGSPPAEDWLMRHRGAFERIVLIGGEVAISERVQRFVDAAAQ